MASFQTRGESCTATVRKKQGKIVIYQESKTWTGREAESLARDWAERLEARIRRDGVPQRQLAVTTLGELIRRRLTALISTDGPEPGRSRVSHLETLAVEFADTPLAGLTSAFFVGYAKRRRAAGAGPATVLLDLAAVRAVLGTAKPLYDLDVSAQPVKDAIKALGEERIVAKSRKRTRRPTPAELAQLDQEYQRIAAFPSTKIPMAAITRLAIAFPRRLGELTAMLWVDRHRAKGGSIIILRDTKNPNEPRTETCPLLPEAHMIIESLPVVDERILPYNSESISAAHQRACERLGIEDLHFHDFRREGVSRLFKAGYSIPEVSKISGHLDWSMLQIYTELRPQDILEKFA